MRKNKGTLTNWSLSYFFSCNFWCSNKIPLLIININPLLQFTWTHQINIRNVCRCCKVEKDEKSHRSIMPNIILINSFSFFFNILSKFYKKTTTTKQKNSRDGLISISPPPKMTGVFCINFYNKINKLILGSK